MNELTKYIVENILNKKVIFVFPGRFQPFHRGHLATYNHYADMYDNVYVLTSNKTNNTDSPFNFEEKKAIMTFQGIPADKIVQVSNPYSSRELSGGTGLLFGKYNVDEYSIVYIVGEKDADRLSKQPKYYKPFDNSIKLQPIKKVSYYTSGVPSDISATVVRKYFASCKPIKQKTQFFKKVFGGYDAKMFGMVNKKLDKCPKLVKEGAAYGHMMHPFENMELTFADYKEIIDKAFTGYLDKEERLVEKTDGMNLLISWKDGHLIFARKPSQVKNKGAEAFNGEELLKTFEGRGNIVEALDFATKDLENAISDLSDKQKAFIFKDGSAFMSLEIIYDKIKNVIPYNTNMLVFHGTRLYDLDGNTISEDKEYGRILAGMIKQVNKDIQERFKIMRPAFITLPNTEDFSDKKEYFINKLNKIERDYSLTDSDTLLDYMRVWWERYVLEKAKEYNYDIPEDVLDMLVKKWGLNEKTKSVVQIQNIVKSENPEFADWIRDFNKNEYESVYKKSILPFELLFLEMGTTLIKNISTFLTSSPTESAKQIKTELRQVIEKIKASGDIDSINQMKNQLEKISKIGGFRTILPSEGIVFRYKGNIYKFTGAFAPVNNILALLKYTKPKKKAEKLNEGGNLSGVTSAISNKNIEETVGNAMELLDMSDVEYKIVGNKWKSYANDVDIAIEISDFMDKLNVDNVDDFWNTLEKSLKSNKYVKNYKMARGLSQVSVVVPVVDSSKKQLNAIDINGNPKNEKAFIQLDLFIGNVEFMSDVMVAPKESKYKGKHRNLLLQCILRHITFPTEKKGLFKKYQFNWKSGIEYVEFYVDKNGKLLKQNRNLVSHDTDDIVHYLFGHRYNFSDIDSFEKLYKLFKSNDYKYKENRKEVIDDFKKELTKAKVNIPDELSESDNLKLLDSLLSEYGIHNKD